DSISSAGGNATTEAHWENGEASFKAGKIHDAGEFDGKRFVSAGDVGKFGFDDKFSLAAWAYPSGPHGGTILSRMTDAEQGDGYYFILENGRLQFNLVKRWLDDALRVEADSPLVTEDWQHVAVTYDGSRGSSGVQIFVNGKLQKLKVLLDLLNQTF